MHTRGSPPSPASWPGFINRRWFSSSGRSFIDPRPSALTGAPRPPPPAPLIRLHPQGPGALPPPEHHLRSRDSQARGPSRPTSAPFQRLESREPSTGARGPYGARPQLLRAPDSLRPVAAPPGPSKSSPLLMHTPDLPRPRQPSAAHHGPCQEANGSTGTNREQLGPPPPPPPPPRHITGLRRQRGLLATAAAAAARAPPLRPRTSGRCSAGR